MSMLLKIGLLGCCGSLGNVLGDGLNLWLNGDLRLGSSGLMVEAVPMLCSR